MVKRIFFFTLLMTSLFTGCSNDDETANRDKILGTWISTDHLDTLEFTDKANFFKKRDHFDYTLYDDSIEINYSGVMYILVMPTKHKYQLNHENLTIDFSNRRCFGFDMKVEHFTRQ